MTREVTNSERVIDVGTIDTKPVDGDVIIVDTTSDSVEEVPDENCFLCVALPAKSPEEGIDPKDFHYAHGFADGVSTSIRAEGPHFCAKHRGLIRRALLDRGVNWGSGETDNTRARLIRG